LELSINIEERKPIWIALSVFYLDTELQKSDFKHIALKIIESPYSFEEVIQINKYEVFPILYSNLLSVSGEWSGFNEEWLIESIASSLNSRSTIKKLAIESLYTAFKWMCKSYWEELKKNYGQLNNSPDF